MRVIFSPLLFTRRDSANGRQRRSSKGDSVEQRPSSGDTSAVSKFNLQEVLELVDGYITRHAEVVPLTREVIKTKVQDCDYSTGLGCKASFNSSSNCSPSSSMASSSAKLQFAAVSAADASPSKTEGCQRMP
jgi:hypothetical protein